MRLPGKVVLVTGAASGMGHAISELFAREGATVFASDIALETPYSAGIESMTLDVTSETDWEKTLDVVVEKNGRLDVLIINLSSIWASAAVAGAHAYHAAKGAVRNMSKNAAMTYVADGIRVNSVHPGFIHTPLTDAQARAQGSLQ